MASNDRLLPRFGRLILCVGAAVLTLGLMPACEDKPANDVPLPHREKYEPPNDEAEESKPAEKESGHEQTGSNGSTAGNTNGRAE